MEFRSYGAMETTLEKAIEWREVWRYGGMEQWRYGAMDLWRRP